MKITGCTLRTSALGDQAGLFKHQSDSCSCHEIFQTTKIEWRQQGEFFEILLSKFLKDSRIRQDVSKLHKQQGYFEVSSRVRGFEDITNFEVLNYRSFSRIRGFIQSEDWRKQWRHEDFLHAKIFWGFNFQDGRKQFGYFEVFWGFLEDGRNNEDFLRF